MYVYGSHSASDQTLTVSDTGVSMTVKKGDIMGKLFGVQQEIDHRCKPDCQPLGNLTLGNLTALNVYGILTRPHWDSPSSRSPSGHIYRSMEKHTEECEAEYRKPRRYLCASCFKKEHPALFRDLAASIIGKAYMINVNDMKLVAPEVGAFR